MDFPSKNHLLPELEPEPEPEPEFDFIDDFPMDTTGVFQDLHQLDDLSHSSSSFDPDYTTHVGGYDPFGPLPFGLVSSNHDLYEFKPLQHVNDGGMLINLNNQNQNKSFMSWSQTDFSTRLGLTECPIQNKKPMSFFVPDEGSCVTNDIRIKKGDKKACKGKNKENSSKGQWTKEEDRILREMVERYGVRKWSYIAQVLKGRIGKQCRERWHNHLRPDIKKDFWTEEEDRILIAAHAQVGNKWSEIAKKLPGRTENSTKNHWNATNRRQFTRRKCRSKWPKPSPILQNYIKSLNLPKGRVNSKSGKNRTSAVAVVKPPPLEVDFDFNEVPEFAMDEKLLEWDEDDDYDDNNIDSLLDDLPFNNQNGEEVDSCFLQGGMKKEIDLMEMISHVNP